MFGIASGLDTPTSKEIRKQLEVKIRETENEQLIQEYFGN
jgi:hypothetical protein